MITTTATATTTPPSDDPGTCSGSTTSSEEGGGLDGVGTELTKKGTVRQKRWTTRGRTGCLTCRARHIKCDEAKPYCRRCVSGRRECRGYDFGSPADAVPPVALHGGSEESTKGHDPSIIQEVVARRQRHYIAEPEPPDWECMEAARYYCVFVLPSCEEQLLTPFSDLPPFHGSNRSIFLLDVSSHRIADASKARGRRGAAAEEPSVDGAWATHSRQMVQILDMVNTGIADKTVRPTNKGNILRRIFTLLVFDLMVDASAWRPHLLGYLALVQHMGGVRALMRLNNEHMNNTQWSILIVAIAANTTSPANQQLRGFEAYTDRDIEFLSAIDVSHELPCPPPLLVVLKNLTQLRARLAEDRCPKTTVERAVRHLFDRISAFDHDTWVKTIHFDLGAEVATLSRIFQVAVRLFGVLSLPQSATVYWAVAASYPRLPGLSAYDSVRIAHRRELLGLLYPFRGTFTSVLALSWPVTVAGASLGGDGSAEDRKFIAESLLDMWQSRLARCGPILCLEKLQVFWAAGKTAWDDCFDEPVPPLA